MYGNAEYDRTDIDENQVVVDLAKSDRGTLFSLSYSSYNTQLPHLEILQNYGHLLKKLDFGIDFQKDIDKDNQNIVQMTKGYYLNHLLKYFPNLEHLNLFVEAAFTKGDPNISENHTITTLTMNADPEEWPRILFELSVRLVLLKFLDLSIIEYLEIGSPPIY